MLHNYLIYLIISNDSYTHPLLLLQCTNYVSTFYSVAVVVYWHYVKCLPFLLTTTKDSTNTISTLHLYTPLKHPIILLTTTKPHHYPNTHPATHPPNHTTIQTPTQQSTTKGWRGNRHQHDDGHNGHLLRHPFRLRQGIPQ